jgi:hypothetical protein
MHVMARKETQHIANLIQKRRSELISSYRIRQTAVGYKIKDGKLTDDVGIIIFVSKKQDESKLRALQIEPIPKHIEGVITDVQSIRFFPRMADDAKYRPIEGGIATIRYPSEYVGTLGLIIRKGNRLYGITNNHVGANEDVLGMRPPAARKKDPWVQPSNGSVPKDLIARLYKWNRLKPQGPGNINYYDFAMGEIVNPGLSDAKYNEIKDIGLVKGIEDINLGDKVTKRGRTTLKTTGRVIAVNARVYVPYQGYNCDFAEQVTIIGDPDPKIPFSLGGDSGSLIVSSESDVRTQAHKAKALLFAGGENEETGFDETTASPIRKIVQDFGLKI